MVAAEYDALVGHDQWRREPRSLLYDYEALRKRREEVEAPPTPRRASFRPPPRTAAATMATPGVGSEWEWEWQVVVLVVLVVVKGEQEQQQQQY